MVSIPLRFDSYQLEGTISQAAEESQFHYGSIHTYGRWRSIQAFTSVSIPLRFDSYFVDDNRIRPGDACLNSTTVRFILILCSFSVHSQSSVSIPLRFDSYKCLDEKPASTTISLNSTTVRFILALIGD